MRTLQPGNFSPRGWRRNGCRASENSGSCSPTLGCFYTRPKDFAGQMILNTTIFARISSLLSLFDLLPRRSRLSIMKNVNSTETSSYCTPEVHKKRTREERDRYFLLLNFVLVFIQFYYRYLLTILLRFLFLFLCRSTRSQPSTDSSYCTPEMHKKRTRDDASDRYPLLFNFCCVFYIFMYVLYIHQ